MSVNSSDYVILLVILLLFGLVRNVNKMANTSDSLQTLDQKINNIKEVLQRKVSPSDEQSLRRMLMAAMEEKEKVMQSQLSSLQAKYGVKSDVIVVDSPPPPTKCIKDPPGKYMKEAAAVSRRRKRTQSEDDPDFEITPPPSKKKLSLPRKKTVITVDESEEEEAPDPRRTPARGKGKGKGKGPAKKTPPPPPSPSPTRASDSDSPAPTPKTTRRRATPRKTTPAGRRRDNPWCSSSSDEGGTSGIPYTLEEMNAMYDVMEAEDPDVVTGKTGHLTKPDKNARLKSLFKKVKRAVNAVGGNNRRKKYLWVKVTDHKSKTILRKKELVKQYGYSGAGGMPADEGLTQIQMRCLNFHGIECAAWARKTQLDRDDGDAGSEAYEHEFQEAEEEQAAMIEDYKASRRNTAQGKREEEQNLAALQKKYKLEPVKTELTVPEPTKAEKEAAKGRRPGRPPKRSTVKASAVLHNTADESDHEESPTSVTPKGRPRSQPEATDRKTRSSERAGKSTEVKQRESVASSRALQFADQEEDHSSGLPEGYGDLTETPIVQDFDEGGSLEYSLRMQSPDDAPAAGANKDASGKSLVSSTPKEDAAISSFRLDKKMVIKITPVEDRQADLTNQQDDDHHDSQHESLPSPTVKQEDLSARQQVQFKVGHESGQVSKAESEQQVKEKSTFAAPKKEPTASTSTGRTAKTQAEFIDQRIEDSVAAGFLSLQADWERLSEQFARVEEQIVSMRVDVQKNNSIGSQLRALRNEVVLLQSTMSSVNSEIVQIKSDMSSLSEEGTNSRSDVQSTQATVASLKADTSALKGDTHALKSKVVANTVTTIAVQSQVNNVLETDLNIAHEIKTLKTDFVHLHGNLITVKVDLASVKQDMITVKSQLSCITSGIENITRSILGRPVGEVRPVDPDIHVKTDSDGEDVSVAPATMAVASTSDPKHLKDVTESTLDTSEVTFKGGPMDTYARASTEKNKSPKTPRKSARMELFNLTDSNIEPLDTQDSQETQDPNLFVENTEFTEDTEPSQSMGWPDSTDLQGTPYAPSAEPKPTASTSSPKPTTSKDKPTIEEGRGTFITVIDTESGRSVEDPVSLVPAHCVRDLERRLSKPSKTRSKSATTKK